MNFLICASPILNADVRRGYRKRSHKNRGELEAEQQFWERVESIKETIEAKRREHNRAVTKPVHDQILIAVADRSHITEVCGRKVATAHEAAYWAITAVLTALVVGSPPVSKSVLDYIARVREHLGGLKIAYESIDAEIQVEFAMAARRVERAAASAAPGVTTKTIAAAADGAQRAEGDDERLDDAESKSREKPSMVLRGRGVGPLVSGVEMPPLSDAQYNVVRALVGAGEAGLSKDELIKQSGHADAVNVLKYLVRGNPAWDSVAPLPGKPGRRYRLLRASCDNR